MDSGMANSAHRYYGRSPDGTMIVGYDDLDMGLFVALEYGDGAHLVDTRAQANHLIAQQVSGGEFAYVDIGGWGAGKCTVERNLIESIKKGHVAEDCQVTCPPKTDPDRMLDLDRFVGGQDGEEEAHG